MPRLRTDTIVSHKASIREAILNATDRIVVSGGMSDLNMAAVAKEAGIGRATLYKYYPDLDHVLEAWHARQVAQHIEHLAKMVACDLAPVAKLTDTLLAFVTLRYGHQDRHVHEQLHQSAGVQTGEAAVSGLLAGVILEGQELNLFRTDHPADELARFCIGAVSNASLSRDARKRLIQLAIEAIKA